ncbi:hypothetical protein E4G67_02585 [Candidatus Bathyarchaeota archaeon]|nr:MAG: hypothetical protein E4G67_02585 [Candidatus Bathyarchaeota archaeon]
MRLDEILPIIVFTIIALLIVKKFSKKPHKTLTHFATANIVLDLTAIAIWGIFPSIQWTIYRLDFLIVGTEAAFAAGLFAITLFGLIKSKRWAPMLAIILTITQRVFATYIFFPSSGNVITLIWSLLIIYFAYIDVKHPNANGQAKTPQVASTPP